MEKARRYVKRILSSDSVLIITILLGLVLFGLVDGVPFALSDGYGYYHTAKSLSSEGTFVVEKEPDYYEYASHGVDFHKGKYVNRYSPGSAILWAPILELVEVFDDGTENSDYYKAFNGHSLADGLAVLVTSICLFFVSILFTLQMLKEIGIRRKVRYFAVILGVLGLTILPYVFEYPFFSHVNEVLAISGFMYFYILVRKTDSSLRHFALLGIFAGLLVLIRPTNVVFVIIFGAVLLIERVSLKKLLITAIAGFPFLVFFLVYNKVLYGNMLTSGYSAIVGQGFDFHQIYLYELLFSSVRGWFIYTPMALLGIIGLIISIIRKNQLAIVIPSFISVVSLILIYSFWPMWWAGDSIGNRFFLVLFPIIVVGVAFLLNSLRKNKWYSYFIIILTVCLVIYSLGLVFIIRLTPMNTLNKPDYNDGNIDQDYSYIDESERTSVDLIMKYHFEIIEESTDFSDYLERLQLGLYGGRSVLMLLFGMSDPIVNVEQLPGNEYLIHFIPNSVRKSTPSNLSVVVTSDTGVCRLELYDDFNIYKSVKLEILQDECLLGGKQHFPFGASEGISQKVTIGGNAFQFESDTNTKFVDYKTEGAE